MTRHFNRAAAKDAVREDRGRTIEAMRHWGKEIVEGTPDYWRGYKLHLDVADGQIPVSAILTGANVHDATVAIPFMTMSA